MAELRIGTSGWSYKHWHDGVFYPEDLKRRQELAHYVTVFDTVELNSSFYHVPKETTMQGWRQKTPDEFVFALKASRYITHRLKLADAQEPLALFCSRAELLGDKLGPILFQLPPSFHLDLDRLRSFVSLLPEDARFTFEFRSDTWFCGEVYSLFEKHNVALTVADAPRYPCVERATADFVYVRLHGHEKLYASDYSDEQLDEWAKKIRGWMDEGRDVYCYFDNDFHGYAPANAATLREMLADG